MKYLKFSILPFIYFIIYVLIIFGYSFNEEKGIVGELSRLVNKINSVGRRYINHEQFFYINTKFLRPIKSDIIIDLSDNDKAFNSLKIQGVLKSENLLLDKDKKWRKTNIFHNKKNIKVKYKFHGSSLYPYSRGDGSYSIKSEEEILGKKRFKLISGLEMSYINIFLNLISHKNKLIVEDKGQIVVVNINGEKRDYFMYETFDENYITKHYDLFNPIIVRNNTFDDLGRTWHESEFDSNPYNLDMENISIHHFNWWNDLLHNNFNDLPIDKEYFGRFFALLYLFGSPHQILGNNDKWVLSENKILPIFRNEGSIRALDIDIQKFDNSLFNNNNYSSQTYLKYKKLLIDPEIIRNRNFYLNEIVKNQEKIFSTYDSIYLANIDKHKKYNVDYLKIKCNYVKQRKILNSNLRTIKKYLSYGHVIIAELKDTLEIFSSRNNDFEFLTDSLTIKFRSKKWDLNDKNGIESKIIRNKFFIGDKPNLGGTRIKIVDLITKDTLTQANEKLDYVTIN